MSKLTPASSHVSLSADLGDDRYERLVQAVVDYAIYLLDPNGRVQSWNSGAARIKGYGAEEIVGQPFSLFYTPEDREAGKPERALRLAAEAGRFEDEGWRVRKDGSRFWALVVVDAVHDDDGRLIGFAKITRDITERREAEERLAEAREQLFQSQKMEALGRLTGGVAHDFNNLLTSVLGATHLAQRRAGGDPRLSELLDTVRTAAQRGGDLTRQLLAFARRQPLSPELLDLHRRLPATAGIVRHSLRPDIDLVLELSDQIWRIEADPGQLELALLNLAVNARDAMPDGGAMHVSACNVTLNGEIEGLVGDFVAISIADTGQGVSPEVRDKVFEPFFTTKPVGEGAGLGLSQVYGFARQSNGAATLENAPSGGAVATVYLPAAARGATVTDADGGAEVLIVEDDPVVAMLAADILEELGCRVRVVNSAREALAALPVEAGLKLVFSDVVMPGGQSGLELAREIRSRRPELPVLLTTGHSQGVAANPGEFPVLAKPYEPQQLEAWIRRLVPTAPRLAAG
ncbi:PAS domain-containing sensor histidine kinase [Caulobacter sp. 17J65-9]|uniref:PAS domain-containing sensor histidine kinase n=1 Tax=Caulobacter sp. 17J65-9 TaxID=2709382 RepID=UPI0013CCD503|nr:PAS domain-containing sensor histidine kinase [Caulobacter sp. 17J65-9]NEX94843.1 PAS domain S-box protein [Caulobacter sp. 17J65-9]